MAELRGPAGKRENAMKTYHILFNPHAGNGHGEEEAHRLDAMLEGAALVYHNMTQIADYEDFFRTIPADEDVVLCGGDGTLNRFIKTRRASASRTSCSISASAAETISCMISARKRARRPSQ